MIKPRTNKLIFIFFSWYIQRIIKADFEKFEFTDTPFSSDKAILLLSNHFSWWDGFLLFHLNRIYFKKHFHVMILEETARSVKFLKYLGAFSVNKNAKSLLDSLSYAGKLLDDPKNLVLIFPQGKLHSMHTANVNFEKGLSKIIAFSNQKFQFIFCTILTDYLNKRKPSIKIYLSNWNAIPNQKLQVIEDAYHKHYKQSVQSQQELVI